MTSANDNTSFAGQRNIRTQLVVPKLHNSVWGSGRPAAEQPLLSDIKPSARQVQVSASPRPVNDVQVRIQPRTLARSTQRLQSPRGVVSQPIATTNTVSRTGQTIQPIEAQQSVAKPINDIQSTAKNNIQLNRQAILDKATKVRMQAKMAAEAQAIADMKERMEKVRALADERIRATKQQNDLTSIMLRSADEPNESDKVIRTVDVFAPAVVNPVVKSSNVATSATKAPAMAAAIDNQAQSESVAPVDLTGIDQSGVAAIPQDNLFRKLASAKITISFKFNKKRFFTVLRYLAIVVIVAASGYLAWDTYMTNQAVKDSFNGSSAASAMSIAGTNPATADQTAISREDKAAYIVPADQPRYIDIPAINVNARVMSVGVNSKGNIDTPANLNDTAWYDGSAKPGQAGQVFIDGHTSFSNTINAAFNRLPELKQGDLITIELGNGTKINYRVSSVETVDADKVDMGKALNPPEGATKGLTLMTCTGTFDYRSQTADQRLIVYAVQE